MPDPESTTVSFEIDGLPCPSRCAPCPLTELAQPLPATPELPHEQTEPEPSPGQNTIPVLGPPRTSWKPLIEPSCPPCPSTWSVIVPFVTLTWCSAYVTPSTCGDPDHEPPMLCGPSVDPLTVTSVVLPLFSGAQAYVYSV